VARFIRAFHTSQLVSPVLMDQVHQKAPGPPFWPGGTFPCLGDFEMYYGYGTEIAEIYLFNSSDTLRVYGHGGNGLGNSGTFHSPDSSITISVTTNDYSNSAGFGTGQVLSEIFCLLFGNITPGTCLTGVEETTGSSGVSLYPNPGSEQMVVKMSNGSISERIEILTIDGKLLYEYQNVSAELEISTRDLTEGVYLVRVFTDDGWVVSRWIKQ
jgi:hypothetical protein